MLVILHLNLIEYVCPIIGNATYRTDLVYSLICNLYHPGMLTLTCRIFSCHPIHLSHLTLFLNQVWHSGVELHPP